MQDVNQRHSFCYGFPVVALFESAWPVQAIEDLQSASLQRRPSPLRSKGRRTVQMIDQLLAFLEIDAETIASAETLSDLLAPRLDEIIEDFYNHMQGYEINALITADVIPSLKEKQKQHWLALFKSQFGPDYCSSVRRIAIHHRDIDLNPLWYVAGYMHLKLAYIDVIMSSDYGPVTKRKLLKTLEKYIAADMALALSAYDAVVLT